MNGLGFLNVELTSRCQKKCFCCGRRKLEREHPELCDWGDMEFDMVEKIADQVPEGIIVQFHNSGDPLLYPDLGHALSLFRGNIRCFNTNAKLLIEKADEIIGNMETLTISVIQDDPEGDDQYATVCDFIKRKGIRKPSLVFRLLGKIDYPERWYRLPGLVATRILHDPDGSRNYEKSVTIPEIGICLDLLTHLAIDRFGRISLCVRFDPEGDLMIDYFGDVTLEEAWNSEFRRNIIQKHIEGKRNEINGCKKCDYYGLPRGYD